MRRLIRRIRGFYKREDGATAVEYGLFVALVAGAIIGAVALLGGTVGNSFNDTTITITNNNNN